MLITVGTNIALILSASCCTGGFSVCASLTIFKIFASTVSSPTAVTYAFTVPLSSILPPMSLSFIFFSTGALSPLMMASLYWLHPKVSCNPSERFAGFNE
jgi:hypothetical protein